MRAIDRLTRLERAAAPAPARYKPPSTDELLATMGVDRETLAGYPGNSLAEKTAAWLGVSYKDFVGDLRARGANAPVNPAWHVNWWKK